MQIDLKRVFPALFYANILHPQPDRVNYDRQFSMYFFTYKKAASHYPPDSAKRLFRVMFMKKTSYSFSGTYIIQRFPALCCTFLNTMRLYYYFSLSVLISFSGLLRGEKGIVSLREVGQNHAFVSSPIMLTRRFGISQVPGFFIPRRT